MGSEAIGSRKMVIELSVTAVFMVVIGDPP